MIAVLTVFFASFLFLGDASPLRGGIPPILHLRGCVFSAFFVSVSFHSSYGYPDLEQSIFFAWLPFVARPAGVNFFWFRDLLSFYFPLIPFLLLVALSGFFLDQPFPQDVLSSTHPTPTAPLVRVFDIWLP